MATVTITGAAGAVNSITLDSAQTLALGQQIANAINAAAASSTLVAENFPGPFGSPGSGVSEAVILPAGGNGTFAGPAGFNYVVNAATLPVTLTAAAAQTVLSGIGGGAFNLVGGDHLVAGGGPSAVSLSGASNFITLADGANTIFGGSGTASTISAGTGNATIFGSSNTGGTVFLSAGNNDVIEGTGSETIIGGSGAATIFGSATSNTLAFGNTGPLTFVASTGASTVVGGATGPTLFGSVGSDVSYAGASGTLYVAGDGNETLDASTSTGNNTLFGGSLLSSTSELTGGSGADTLVGGPGFASLTGGAGDNVFAFFQSNGGGVDLIQNFTANDQALLSGYGPSGITSSTVVGGSTVLILSDNTTITFSGITNLNMNQIIKT